MATTTLEEFLKTKSQKNGDAEALRQAWIQRKDKWIEQVNSLYDQLEEWLKPLGNFGKVKSERSPISIHEELIGLYEIDQLEIFFVGERVEFMPRGTNLFLGFGRIDITPFNINRQQMLVIPEWGKWAFYQLDRSIPTSPKPIYEPLTEDSFKRVMLDLIS